MPVEGRGVELREGVDLGHVAVDAVADRDVDQAVVGAQGHGGLGAALGQGVQAGASTTTQNDAQHGLQCVPKERPIKRRGVALTGEVRPLRS